MSIGWGVLSRDINYCERGVEGRKKMTSTTDGLGGEREKGGN